MTAIGTTFAEASGNGAPEDGERLSPYLGLSYYTEADSPRFFGREAERQVIMGNLRASRLTLLYAQSGVGKSSLLRAGVAARLRALAHQAVDVGGSACYLPVVFSSWRDDPTADLVEAIHAATNDVLGAEARVELPRDSLMAAIEVAALALDRAVTRDSADRPGSTLLIILDQFEEYFLYGSREARTGRFAEELAECINSANLRANFLISIRDDAYSALGDLLKGRMSNIYGNYLHLEYLDPGAAREAIEKPVEYYNSLQSPDDRVSVEPGLVDTVLAQVRRGSDGERQEENGNRTAPGRRPEILTPYLQLVMSALWSREQSRGSHVLRRLTLDELHGAEKIVARHLDEALDKLPPGDRETAIDFLHYLVTPSGAKVALEVADLAAYTHHPVERIVAILTALAGKQRIVREVPRAPGRSEEDETGRRFEIYHDVVADPINEAVRATATRRLQREKHEAEERARRERTRARTFRTLAGVSLILLLVAIVAVILATVETGRARSAQHAALSRQLAAQAVAALGSGDFVRGSLLSIEAYRSAATADARNALVRAEEATQGMVATMRGHTDAVSGVAFSPDGRTIASASADETAILWHTATARPFVALRGHHAGLSGIAFSPDGSLLASSDAKGTVILWNGRTGQESRVLTRGQGVAVENLAFSPTGNLLATCGDDGQVTLWDPATAQRLRVLRAGSTLYSVAFSPAGGMVASGGADRRVLIWDARTGRLLRMINAGAVVNAVAFSPAGHLVAIGRGDNTVALYDPGSGRQLVTLHGPTQAVNGVAFSPDGSLIAASSDDDTVTLWNAHSHRRLAVMVGHTAPVNAVAFSPDGHMLVSGSTDGGLILWRVTTAGLRTLVPGIGSVQAVAFSRSGGLLASGGADGRAIVWNAATGRPVQTLPKANPGGVEAVAFSPSNGLLATAGDDPRIVLWDPTTGRALHVLTGHSASVFGLAFSSDGALLASAGADDLVMVWNAHTGQRIRVLRGHTNAVNAVAFSPDGQTLASGGIDQEIVLWNIVTGQRERTLSAPSTVNALAFSPDGRTLASAGGDDVVTLWDVSTGEPVGDPFMGQQDVISSLAFSPDERMLASGSNDATVMLWNVANRLGIPIAGHTRGVTSVTFSPNGGTVASGGHDALLTLAPVPPASSLTAAAVIGRLCRVVRRNLTRTEWHQAIPDEPYRKTCVS